MRCIGIPPDLLSSSGFVISMIIIIAIMKGNPHGKKVIIAKAVSSMPATTNRPVTGVVKISQYVFRIGRDISIMITRHRLRPNFFISLS
jgi:hypothetical protein